MKLSKFVFMSITTLLLLVALPALSQTPIVKIDPATTSTDIGESFMISVIIEGASNLRGISVKIEFDPQILEALQVSSGGFMSGFGQTFSFSDKDNDEGWAQYDESILGSGDMAQGDGVICKIDFKALANGVSSLTFVTADLRDRDNQPVTTDVLNGTVMVGGSAVLAKVKVMLEGPYDSDSLMMVTRLQEQNLIPLTSPYAAAAQTVTDVPSGIVDWILVELRTTAGITVAQKSCFLKSDGNVVEAENQSATLTFFDLESGDYFIVLHHRNHLAVMSADAVALSGDAPAIYDFTQSASKYRGNEARLLKSNPDVYGMFAGDGDASDQISQPDRDDVIQNRDATGYESNDYNLSGIVTISDMDFAASNNGKSTNVPEN